MLELVPASMTMISTMPDNDDLGNGTYQALEGKAF